MTRVLVTGMSGAGKSTLLAELSRRGHEAIDTDYDGWTMPDGTWDEPRMAQLLATRRAVVVSGTVANQGRLYDRFDHVVLLSVPLDVLLIRVARDRTTTTEGSDFRAQELGRERIRFGRGVKGIPWSRVDYSDLSTKWPMVDLLRRSRDDLYRLADSAR